ncbi:MULTISPECIES: Gfo/Idh/MocA family oxidoreductase [Clostridium]|uniref:Gfo/Idh/MocA family oxidoreductase n=1 Tax=Clostridium aquiflavi TaxID=3073603 RepID=A0ABU1EE14_9CLOT|nr:MULTISPECIES: Gfo/Idh/MocA family oxidoreductase [unclassified Clostridium]MDR5586528.1 Gfo/Idh/MocA family oxidoreductase [Clostridium sp. 5N-1]
MGKKYNVLIVGAGNIGAFFDNPSSENILTHAHAFLKIEGFNLLGFVETSKKKGEEAAKLWKVNYFSTIEEAFSENDIDVVSICVPDNYHYSILKKISNFPIKLVFCEKPLVKNINEANEIIRIYKEKNIRCLVNYSRRFVAEFSILKDSILEGNYGKFLCGSGYYGKGVLHNGSHLIDLLRYLIGEIKDFKVINHSYDFYDDDPSVSAVLNFENGGDFVMQNIPYYNYTIFELELLFEKKRIKIIDSGFKIQEYSVSDSKVFSGYKNLFKEKEYETELNKAMLNAVTNIYNNLIYNEKLNCVLEDGYKDMEICERLKVMN